MLLREILNVLTREDMSGYQIAQEILKRSPELLADGEGVIYPALMLLEDKEYVKGRWVRMDIDGRPRRRRYHSITPAGLKRLKSRLLFGWWN